MKTRTTTRVQLELKPEAMKRLQKLKVRSEAASYAEVVRMALMHYDAHLDNQERFINKLKSAGLGPDTY